MWSRLKVTIVPELLDEVEDEDEPDGVDEDESLEVEPSPLVMV